MQLPRIEKWSLLAGLRFLLASIVAVNHLPNFIPIGGWDFIPKFGAFEAILGFLLISGFSIGASFMREPDGFLLRRVQRIYPIYLTAIALAYFVFVSEHAAHPSPWVVLVNLFFLNQVFTPDSMIGPAWSLSLEFWLYCLTPLLFMCKDAALRKLMWLSLAAFVVYTCGRTLFGWDYYSGTRWGLNLPLLSFIWLAGLRLARNASQPKPVLKEVGLLFAAHIMLAASIQFAAQWKHSNLQVFFEHDLVEFVMRAGTLTFVLWTFVRLLTGERVKKQTSRFLRTLGDMSYPLYLIHIPIYYVLDRIGLQSPSAYFGIAALVSLALFWMVDQYARRRHLRVGSGAPTDALRWRDFADPRLDFADTARIR